MAEDSSEAPSHDRLDSWKEIAAYLRRDVTTVQRWERRERMPVHRHLHDKLGSVYAYRSELDAWTQERNLRSGRTDDEPASPPQLSEGPAARSLPGPVSEETLQASRRTRSRRTIVATLLGVALLGILGAIGWQLARSDRFWHSPLEDARFQYITDFGGAEQAASISRDGKFVAFLSDRGGSIDVWVTQVGTGQSYNLTRGRVKQLVNPSVRTLGFSPDGTLVTFWALGVEGSSARDIGVWAVPTLGGSLRPYIDGAAEFDWSRDGARLVYHTPGPGDPMFVKRPGQQEARRIFVAAPGLHGHYPSWSPDGAFIYFVQGSPPDGMDIWRLEPAGGSTERITRHESRVSHPVLLNDRMLMYLATDKDGSGPWLYALDVNRRVAHRVGAPPSRFTSLAASSDGRRLVATVANARGTLWRLPLGDEPVGLSAATQIALTTARGFAPRLGPAYLLYVSSKGAGDGIWKLVGGAAAELWSAPDARIIGGPEITSDGQRVSFSVEQRGQTLLYVMDADGTNARVVTSSLELRGSPAWAPDGRSIASSAIVNGTPHLFRVSLDGAAVPLVHEYAVDPVWSPDGQVLVYSGADVGTAFPVKAVTMDARPHAMPNLTLTRGARRLRFVGGRRALVGMRGELQHKDLWLINLETGSERRLTNFPPDFDVRDFDVSSDGREVVVERVQERSDVVLIDLPQP